MDNDTAINGIKYIVKYLQEQIEEVPKLTGFLSETLPAFDMEAEAVISAYKSIVKGKVYAEILSNLLEKVELLDQAKKEELNAHIKGLDLIIQGMEEALVDELS